jgi:uncharacterized protein YjdB
MNKEAIKIENNNYEPSVAQDVTPENKKNNNTKKIIAIVTSVIVVICLAVGIWFVVENNANKWDLKQNEVTIEYGEVYEPTIADLVDVEKYSNVTDDNTDVKVNATYEASKQNEELAYYAVGDYDIDVIHKIEYKLFGTTIFTMDDTKKIKLEVKDTVAPVFAEDVPTELETYRDCEIENLEEKFKANDIAPVTISIDKENIDYTTVGEYTINVYATDESGNVATKEIKVKVLEPSISIEPTILDMTVGNTANLTATVKGKDQTVEWTSSDESIAKVENGTVTAQKEGTTTVVAKANGTETSATVVVANVTQKKSSSNQNIGTTQSQGNKNSSSSASNGNSSSNSTGSSGGSTSSASTTTTAPSAYYCDEGGSHHRRNVGQIGWCNSVEEAENAITKYFNEHPNLKHYTIAKCSCGKYTAYIK